MPDIIFILQQKLVNAPTGRKAYYPFLKGQTPILYRLYLDDIAMVLAEPFHSAARAGFPPGEGNHASKTDTSAHGKAPYIQLHP